MREKKRQAVAAQVADVRRRMNATVDGNARAVLDYFRSGNTALIPDNVSMADVKLAAAAVREEDYASAGNLPGALALGAAIGRASVSAVLDYVERLERPATGREAGGLAVRLDLELAPRA